MAQYKETGNVQEGIAQLAQASGLEWVAEIADRDDVDWQAVLEGNPYAGTLEGGVSFLDRGQINRVTIGEGEIIIRSVPDTDRITFRLSAWSPSTKNGLCHRPPDPDDNKAAPKGCGPPALT
ncbi:hypothetical protein [Pseudodesulfovibrio sp.]|uniref:hypothetical protein n=1 Tax=unclassified Pseudodesulfovibrio TaxID=2661612 RepID=UPI003B00056C